MCCQTANNRLDAGNSELASHIFGGNITGIMLCSTLCRLCCGRRYVTPACSPTVDARNRRVGAHISFERLVVTIAS